MHCARVTRRLARRQHVSKLDEELRRYTNAYQENKQLLTQLQRKRRSAGRTCDVSPRASASPAPPPPPRRSGNLMVVNLKDVLSDELIQAATNGQPIDEHFISTEYLRTVVVVLPK